MTGKPTNVRLVDDTHSFLGTGLDNSEIFFHLNDFACLFDLE